MERENIITGDCIEEMRKLDDESVDAVITDPPYGLSFMGKEWDGFSNNEALQEWTREWAVECWRVLKPGGHLLSFGGTRTMHRITTGIEEAGFEVRDTIMWVYASGFPKSLNIGKAVDKKLGNEREVIGKSKWSQPAKSGHHAGLTDKNVKYTGENKERYTPVETRGNSEWEGFGTALKPAHEPIVLARKPLSEKSIVNQVLTNGCGGLDIDGCRIPIKSSDDVFAKNPHTERKSTDDYDGNCYGKYSESKYEIGSKGRFPANVICQDDALNDGELTKNQGHWSKSKTTGFGKFGGGTSEYSGVGEKDKSFGSKSRYFDLDLWAEKNGILNVPKASKSEKNKGCEELEENNRHPTTKPVKLMSWLVKLVSKEGDTVLDPFIGSGTTGVACKKLGRNFVGIEKESEYVKIARARINAEVQEEPS